jgi:hypothetical protein
MGLAVANLPALLVSHKKAPKLPGTNRTGLLRIYGDTMKNKPVPKGLEKFDGLLSKLAKVPKEELNAKLTKQNKKRRSR